MAENADKRAARVAADRLLARAAQLIAEPSGWTKRELARDRHSKRVSPSSERAVHFCAGGALLRATSEQFEVGFCLGEAGDELVGDAWVLPLALAHYYLGRAFLLLYVPSADLASEQPNAVADTKWLEVVNTVNDAPAIKHRHVVAGFEVARKIAAINRWESREEEEEQGAVDLD